MTHPNPTLLIGLGAFGRQVARRLAPATDAATERAPLQVICSADAGGSDGDGDSDSDLGAVIAALVTEAEERCRRLLALGHFVDTTAPTDARGPRLDVFVIADLGEVRAARAVAGLVERLARELRSAFRPILGAGEGALAVCPMVVAPRSAPDVAAPIRALAALARHEDRACRPQARVYVIEDQSGKYLLPADELERSFAAFLSLVLMSRLRDDPGVRDLVEPRPSTADQAGPLATFACATLEIDTTSLHKLCAYRLAREVLDHFDAGALTLKEIAGEAHPLVPDRTAVESHLWSEGAEGSLEEYLQPPRLPVPDIAWTDAPEDIVDHKLGPTWRMDTERAIERFRDEVERFKMDRLATRIESNGTELASKVEGELMDRVRGHALSGPRGPERALEFARYAAERSRGLMDQVKGALDAPDLRDVPDSPLEDGLEAIARAARAWPRPYRMRFFGTLAAVASAFVIAALVHMGLAMVGVDLPWWVSGLGGAILAGSSTRYALWRHRKQHHNWLCAARDDLDQALQRHLRSDLVDYFRRRLDYTRALWTYRIYRRITEMLDGVVRQLEAGRAAVDEARRRLLAEEHDLLQRQSSQARRGILYRSVLDADTVDAVYGHVRPPELASTAARYHARATGQARDGTGAGDTAEAATTATTADSGPASVDVLEAPYADPERALAFAERELADLRALSPYEEATTPLYDAVAASVQRYLEQLALKLSPPLELVAARAAEAPAARRVLIAPPAARALIERTLASHNLDSGWDIRSISADARRIHLLVERGELPVDAVAAVAGGPGPARAPRRKQPIEASS